jgi:hypothetical protein
MLLSHHQNAGQNKNFNQEEIKRKLNSGNAYYHSVQNLLSSHLLSKNKNLNIQDYNFAYGSIHCETWF